MPTDTLDHSASTEDASMSAVAADIKEMKKNIKELSWLVAFSLCLLSAILTRIFIA